MIYRALWADFFKLPVDELPEYEEGIRAEIKSAFLTGEWYTPYEIIEFILGHGDMHNDQRLAASVSTVLTEEMAGFRLIQGKFVEITDESEVTAIEESLSITQADRFAPAREHLAAALTMLSNRRAPDYRNSIKESISAVEAVVQILTGDPRAELGKGLKLLEKSTPLHGAFRTGLQSLYGYTSDADGIRHALTGEPSVDAADAKFMLVACAAFVVYLIQRAGELPRA